MKTIVLTLLTLTAFGCSRDRTTNERHKAEETQRESEARTTTQATHEKSALQTYDADARAACAAELKRRLKPPVTVMPEGTTVKWDPSYLAGERARTKQQFPASEAFVVRMLIEQMKAGQTSQTQFTCEVICLNQGFCNAVAVKP